MRFAASVLVLSLLAGPALAQEMAPPTARELARIDRILHTTPLIDGHNDAPWEIRDNHGNALDNVDFNSDTRLLAPPMHTDWPRMRQGRVGGQFWSVYVSADLRGADSTRAVHEQIDLTRRMIQRYPDVLELASTADDVVRIHRRGRIASMFGIEGGEAIDGNLAVLREFYASGVRYMTLTHSKTTAWCDSATDAPRHGGLSPFGEEVVREMNRVGMLVDLSHVSADAMRDALRVSTAPVIFSHSSAFGITPHVRNVPDDVLEMVRDNGGVMMVNFYPGFTSTEFWNYDATRNAEEARIKSFNRADPDAVERLLAEWTAAHPGPRVDVGVIADHIEYIGRVAGRDHVGLGSDFDGVPFLPVGLDGVEDYPALLVELARRGWTDREIAGVAGGNVLRVMRQAEAVAARS